MSYEYFILLFLINNINSYIVCNIELFPKDNYKTLYEQNSPKDIISKELNYLFHLTLPK